MDRLVVSSLLLVFLTWPINSGIGPVKFVEMVIILGVFPLLFLSTKAFNYKMGRPFVLGLLFFFLGISGTTLFSLLGSPSSGAMKDPILWFLKFSFSVFSICALLLLMRSVRAHPLARRIFPTMVIACGLLLCAWSWFLAVESGFLIRASFPRISLGSSGDDESFEMDGHIFSMAMACVAIGSVGMVAPYFVRRKGMSFWGGGVLLVLLATILSSGIFLTGSRTGVLGVGFVFFLVAFYFRRSPVLVASVLAMALVGVVLEFDAVASLGKVVERSLDFRVGSDASSMGRLRKIAIGLQHYTEHGLIFWGPGAIGLPFLWVDNGVVAIFVHGGLLALGGMSVLLFGFFRKVLGLLRSRSLDLDRAVPIFILIGYFFCANLISEYFLVTRGFCPFVLCLGVLLYFSCERKGASVVKIPVDGIRTGAE